MGLFIIFVYNITMFLKNNIVVFIILLSMLSVGLTFYKTIFIRNFVIINYVPGEEE